MVNSSDVGILYTNVFKYPDKNRENWFLPNQSFPELDYEGNGRNELYQSIRDLFILYEMDSFHYGTPDWNPLGDIIKPGDHVLIKPNMVMDINHNKKGGTDCLYTQPSLVAPVIDYCLIALKGKGRITVGDAPMQECDFENLLETSGYSQVFDHFAGRSVPIEIVDFRELTSNMGCLGLVHHQRIIKSSAGTVIDLKGESEFSQYDAEHLNRLRITNYSPDRLREHHREGKHEYYISNYMLEADVVINMPKPKTHRKAGYTAALKNMVGINVRKEYLPHHTLGSESEQGDEYKHKSLIRRIDAYLYDKKNTLEGNRRYVLATLMMLLAGGLKAITKAMYKTSTEGSWYGNHTISKTIVDLNKILLYANKQGHMQESIQRKVLTIGDMIICGEKEGPVSPSPKELGVLVIGADGFNFDKAVGYMMGAEISKISFIKDVINSRGKYSISENKVSELPVIIYNDKSQRCLSGGIIEKARWNLIPPNGWAEVFTEGKK